MEEERSSVERLHWLEQASEEAVPTPWGHGGCHRYDHPRLIITLKLLPVGGKGTSPAAVAAVAAARAGARHLLL